MATVVIYSHYFPPSNRFPVDDEGTVISVVEYFRQKYNIALRYGFLPAINVGTDAKPTYLPMEVFPCL